MSEKVKHPSHYGGQNNPYEAIKVIEAWGLNFKLGNVVKYIARAGKKDEILQELKKAQWYLEREIEILDPENLTKTRLNERKLKELGFEHYTNNKQETWRIGEFSLTVEPQNTILYGKFYIETVYQLQQLHFGLTGRELPPPSC